MPAEATPPAPIPRCVTTVPTFPTWSLPAPRIRLVARAAPAEKLKLFDLCRLPQSPVQIRAQPLVLLFPQVGHQLSLHFREGPCTRRNVRVQPKHRVGAP